MSLSVAESVNQVAGVVACAMERGQKALSEYDSKRVLATYGVLVVQEELVRSAAEAAEAAERLGYPVAVKACSPALMHKSDRGLVFLNLSDASSVKSAADQISKAAGATPLDGYLVQQMVRGKREVIVGATRDRLFGPCVMLGLGGILVEAIADVAFRLAPLQERDALEMIHEMRAQRIFEEFRGEPAVDRLALSRVLIGVGQILIDHPSISQVDVNPLIVRGADPVAVDALITLAPA
jgi:succinyl-CoA synthetase beta subunit